MGGTIYELRGIAKRLRQKAEKGAPHNFSIRDYLDFGPVRPSHIAADAD